MFSGWFGMIGIGCNIAISESLLGKTVVSLPGGSMVVELFMPEEGSAVMDGGHECL